MPTVFRKGPYRFHFYSREPGEPPHIHVARDDFEAKFWLSCPRGHKIVGIIRENEDNLLKAWDSYHG